MDDVLHAAYRTLIISDRYLQKPAARSPSKTQNMIAATRTFLSHSAQHDQSFPDPTTYGPSPRLSNPDGSQMTPGTLASDADYWKQAARPTYVAPHYV
jgi:hypothetical protein